MSGKAGARASLYACERACVHVCVCAHALVRFAVLEVSDEFSEQFSCFFVDDLHESSKALQSVSTHQETTSRLGDDG